MRRYIALLLVFGLLCALLTGCELFLPSDVKEGMNNSIVSPPIDGETVDPGSTDVVEPENETYGFTVFPEGNYLADPKFDTDEFLPDYDVDTSFIQYQSTGDFGRALDKNRAPVFCSTDSTVYFFNFRTNIVWFFDKATGISAPLCGKPECLHNSTSCNAYVLAPNGLRVYDGKLYWAGGRMNLDGTDRETGPWTVDFSGINTFPTTVIHRGYVYTAGSERNVSGGSPFSGTVTVNATAMDGSESFTLLSKTVNGMSAYCTVKPVGNDLYIMAYYENYLDMDDPEADVYSTVELYRWDSETRQAEFLYKGAEQGSGLFLDIEQFQPVPGDGIYLMGYRFSEVQWSGSYHTYVCKYSFSSGEMEEVMELDCAEGQYYNTPAYTKDYILMLSQKSIGDDVYERTLSLYDYDGNLVYSKYIGEHPYSTLLGLDDDFIYVNCMKNYRTETGYTTVRYCIMVPLDGGEVIVVNAED